jgi:hypothetical protein
LGRSVTDPFRGGGLHGKHACLPPHFIFVGRRSTLERIVAKKKKSNQPKKQKEEQNLDLNQPWISMRKGMIIIAVTSVVMAVLTAWQVVPVKGWVEGILWGLFFGALVWAIFFGNILINKFLRRR